MTTHQARLFPGQPPGFHTLFFTELWERFSYYGMRAILVLFLVGELAGGGMGLDEPTAIAIYGLYSGGVYLMSIPGGWAADQVLGAQRAVLWGGALIAAGHVLLAIAGAGDWQRLFLLGLAVIVLGTGLLKPNISALVGMLHANTSGGARDAGFTWFYLGINAGATLGPLATAWLAQQFGWHWGFLAAAVGMIGGLWYFLRTRALLGEAGAAPADTGTPAGRRARRLFGVAAALLLGVLGLFALGLVSIPPLTLREHATTVVVAVTCACFLYLLLFAGLDAAGRRGVLVLVVLVAASALFWAGYEQAGTLLNLFAERFTDRMIGHFEFPAGWLQSVPAIFVLVCAPLLAVLWAALAARGRDLPIPVKFALGLAGMGLGFLVMVGAAHLVAAGDGGSVGPIWLVTTYLLHTLGELCLSPVGMSATTQLAPKRFAGMAMGLWFASLAMGNLLASQLAGSVDGADAHQLAGYFVDMFLYGAGGAVVMLVLWPLLSRGSRRNA